MAGVMQAARKVVLAVGLPGAGKSTYFARRGILPLSSDLIREILYDDAADSPITEKSHSRAGED